MNHSATMTIPEGTGVGMGAECWAALVEDTGCEVAVIGYSGVVSYANAGSARVLGRHASDSLGERLTDLLPGEMGAERLGYVRQAIDQNRVITVDGSMRGMLCRTTFRPVTGQDGEKSTLMVSWSSGRRPEPVENVVRAAADDRGALSTLTERETEVLRLIGMGLSTAAIAKELHRSVKTIEWHRVSLGSKLGVTNRVELARIAICAGLSSLPDLEKQTGTRTRATDIA